ncbi:uncharacterized protein BO97DRAFT_467918 [Aspergillus homomorphus CBS 101889]|uniref:F-box domain-containing protein n=1 Tax=Aspergillus homomorphus (strain CBS 101889) TaxID=1450537 RepID=A0A395I9F1_ASPHC|nr:hypothetical protein BO97DRAFT_467918 [Aspergillus homomorphus CBS 101889]RAL16646.1 hypothetical protein BO97DRAFT_467918 [Aspergillus homomorphus CBS 101889]
MLTVDCLPAEVQKRIAFFVRDHSSRDLFALSRTNKAWHELAAAELYQTLRIKFFDLKTLQQDVSELRTDGLGRHYLRYARTLDLVCLEEPYLETKTAKRLWEQKNWANEFIIFKTPTSLDSFLQDSLSECDYSSIAYYHENDWEPIIALVGRLQHLRLLNYAIRNMFPASLHQALQQVHPTCQLDVWSTQSPSLDLPGLGRAHNCVLPEFKQPLDLDFVSSPTLHTLSVAYTVGKQLQDLAGLTHVDEPFSFVLTAPNLKHLIISVTLEGIDRTADKVKEEWKRLYPSAKSSPDTAVLESLTFSCFEPSKPLEHVLLNISTLLDLSRLRSLDIGAYAEPAMLTEAASKMVRLERLYIHMVPWYKQRASRWLSDSDSATWDIEEMISVVQAFRPLRFLCMRGLRSFTSLDRIVAHHPTLQGLSLEVRQRQIERSQNGQKYPITNGDHIRSLAASCPRLEELSLTLQRTQGNAHECDIYRALGQLPCLRTLILELDFDSRPTPDFDAKPSPACIRETLINAAIDETLVTGIFELICSHQSTRRLKHLRIKPGYNLFEGGFADVLAQVSRSFLATRLDFYLTANPPVEVREIGRVVGQLLREEEIAQSGPLYIPKNIKDILEELWPLDSERNRSKKWKEFPLLVKSFPLEADV